VDPLRRTDLSTQAVDSTSSKRYSNMRRNLDPYRTGGAKRERIRPIAVPVVAGTQHWSYRLAGASALSPLGQTPEKPSATSIFIQSLEQTTVGRTLSLAEFSSRLRDW
jgi:hypothetical protein